MQVLDCRAPVPSCIGVIGAAGLRPSSKVWLTGSFVADEEKAQTSHGKFSGCAGEGWSLPVGDHVAVPVDITGRDTDHPLL